MKKKLLSLILIALLAIGLAACGKSGGGQEGGGSGAAEGPKILKAAASFAYSSLDTHKESYGWYTMIYGVSETLFKMNANMGIDPWLADSAEADGTVWTIKLNEKAAFSNGNPVTADMVIRNFQRLAEVNTGYARDRCCAPAWDACLSTSHRRDGRNCRPCSRHSNASACSAAATYRNGAGG